MQPGEQVEGLIIARDYDLKAEYAVGEFAGVRMMRYEVKFNLIPHQR